MAFFTAAAMLTGTAESAGGGGAAEQPANIATARNRAATGARCIEWCRVRTNMFSCLDTRKERHVELVGAALGPLACIIAECRGTPRKYM
jgi:hypothetical protein